MRYLRHFLREASFPWDKFDKPKKGPLKPMPRGAVGRTDADYGVGNDNDLRGLVDELTAMLRDGAVSISAMDAVKLQDKYGREAMKKVGDAGVLFSTGDGVLIHPDKLKKLRVTMPLKKEVVREAPGDDDPDTSDDPTDAGIPQRKPVGADPFAQPATGTVKATTKPHGSLSVTNAKKAQDRMPPAKRADMTWDKEGDLPRPAGQPSQQPGFRGDRLGQVARMGRKVVSKPVAWTDKATGEKRFGRQQGMGDWSEWVWDGGQWVKPGAFDDRFPSTGRKKESFARVFRERRGR